MITLASVSLGHDRAGQGVPAKKSVLFGFVSYTAHPHRISPGVVDEGGIKQ